MSNLKTDDILGARPRIRHAPRNLIRDQRLSQQPPEYSSGYYQGHEGQYQYPYSNNPPPSYGGNYRGSLGQVGMSESFMEPSPNIAGKSSVKIHSVNKTVDRYEEVKRPYILPKDAPVVNYDAYQPISSRNQQNTSYTRAFSGADRELYQKYRNNLNTSRQLRAPEPQLSPRQPEPRLEKPRSMSSQVSSSSKTSQSMSRGNAEESRKAEEKSKNIFRGLGYNIITNSKFAYDMENRLKNSTSKWLE